jgi:glycosyltransferase involved in cell wall biosynthesis
MARTVNSFEDSLLLSESKMKIAIVGQNNIMSDARILKSWKTLSSVGGFNTKCFGMGWKNELIMPSDIQSELKVCNISNASRKFDRAKKTIAYLFVGSILLTVLLVFLLLGFNSEWSLLFLLTYSIVASTFLYLVKKNWDYIITKVVKGILKDLLIKKVYHSYSSCLLIGLENEGGFSHLHCHDLMGLIAGVKYKHKHPRVTLVWDAHEIYSEMANISPYILRVHKKIIQDSCRYIDRFITINESIGEFYEHTFKELPKPNIIMNATVKSVCPKYDYRLHDAAKVDREKKILLFQGGLSEHRGIKFVLESSRYLNDDWAIVFMGSGYYSNHIKRVSEDRGNISLIPPSPHEELVLWTQGATIGIIPYEGGFLNHALCTPNKLWEYPAARVPLLVSPLVELQKIVLKWKMGIVLEEGFDGKSIARVLNCIPSSLLETMKVNCDNFMNEMSWEVFEPRLLGVFEENKSYHHEPTKAHLH